MRLEMETAIALKVNCSAGVMLTVEASGLRCCPEEAPVFRCHFLDKETRGPKALTEMIYSARCFRLFLPVLHLFLCPYCQRLAYTPWNLGGPCQILQAVTSGQSLPAGSGQLLLSVASSRIARAGQLA